MFFVKIYFCEPSPIYVDSYNMESNFFKDEYDFNPYGS